MQISKIYLNNYRAFYNEKGKELDKHQINFLGKRNLLIYGENGSGKSSLFKGIKDLFLSSVEPDLKLAQNIFSKAIDLDKEPFVNIHFSESEGDKQFIYSSDPGVTNTDDDSLRAIARSRSFMTYRDLLRIHFVENPQVNLFEFLFDGNNSLLGEVTNPVSSVPETNIRMYILWEKVKSNPDKTNIKDFTRGVNQTILDLSNALNFLLKYFDDSLTIKFPALQEVHVKEINPQLCPEIHYYGQKLDEDTGYYHNFLNEARLSALSVCIFLAAHLSVPRKDYEILFLDDIFTGLDMSNRIPLLEILTAETIKGTDDDTFRNHQIILTTYDRNWYKLARNHLGEEEWTYQEIFIDRHSKGFDQALMLPGTDDLKRAYHYFKVKEYPTCANYQRKVCERIIKNFLPEHLKYKKDSRDDIKALDLLGDLTEALFKYLKSLSIDISSLENLKKCIRVVLNPFSHDDIDSQIYRRELELVFDVIIALKSLRSTLLLDSGTKVFIEKKHGKTDVLHKYEFELAESIRIIDFQSIKAVSPIKLLPTQFEIENEHLIMSQSGNIDTLYGRICHFLEADKNDNLLIDFTISEGDKLSDLINV